MQSELERKIFELLTHGYPAPFARVHSLAKQIADLITQEPAALSDKQAGEVKIKPLEWSEVRKDDGSRWRWVAGDYGVTQMDWNGFSSFDISRGHWLAGGPFSDLEAAKAAAQADYEQRIRAALVDVSAEPGTVFASRHNDETGECETVEVEPVKVRELREKIAASARRDYDAHLERINRATDREIDEATKKVPAPKDWDVWTRGKSPSLRAEQGEPVGYLRKCDLACFDPNGAEIKDALLCPRGTLRPDNEVAVYAHPPLSREGEDSAGWTHVQSFHRYPYVVENIGGEWHLRMHDAQTAGVSRTISKHPTWQSALAATRSGSATTAKGCAE